MALPAPSMESTGSQVLKRKSDDIGWEFGQLVDAHILDKVQCKLCGKVMRGGIYRLKQHIAGIIGNVVPCKIACKEDQMRIRNAFNEAKRKKKGKQDDDEVLGALVNIGGNETIDLDVMDDCFGDKEPRFVGPIDKFITYKDIKGKSKQDNVSNVSDKEQMIIVKEYICKWAYECGIPFHVFERDSFKALLEAIGQFGPGALPPTRYEMGDTFLKKEVEKHKISIKKYEEEWKFLGCSIMIDTWSNRKKRSIMNLCVNSKLGTVFLSSKECSDEANTKKHIFEYVDSCIEKVGPENVIQVVTDNTSDNMGAAKLLKEKRPTIFWTSCATHTMNLMLEAISGLPRYKKVLDQAKKLTVFIYAHYKTLAMMRQYTKKRDIVRPRVTRFASAFLTLQNLAEKKSQLRDMFSSDEWKKCKYAKTVKGKFVYTTVISPSFWLGVTLCLKTFAPLVKVLRMVNVDWKPSMGFIYGELKKAKKNIIEALNDNKSAYEPILAIISKKASNRLDSCLHMAAYILNPYYFFNNAEVRDDLDANDALIDFVGTLFPGDYVLQNQILMVELPIYKGKLEKFDRIIALKGCEVNDDNFDPANWWETYGNSTPNLKKIAMRLLSLATSSPGCERNWSTFEEMHTKKRNRLEATKMNNLVFVHFNANLMDKNKKRKDRSLEVLLTKDDDSCAREWLVDCDGDDESSRTSTSRQPFGEEIESGSKEEVDEHDEECESDEVQIVEQCGQNDNGLT